MHDESLDAKLTGLENVAMVLQQALGISSSRAITVVGYVYKQTDDFLSGKEVLAYVQEKAKTPIAQLTEDERLMLYYAGFLVRKKAPFQQTAKNFSRNDACPCGSGLKYKKCCLDMAKAQDFERYNNE